MTMYKKNNSRIVTLILLCHKNRTERLKLLLHDVAKLEINYSAVYNYESKILLMRYSHSLQTKKAQCER
jgi:hypothetical protein